MEQSHTAARIGRGTPQALQTKKCKIFTLSVHATPREAERASTIHHDYVAMISTAHPSDRGFQALARKPYWADLLFVLRRLREPYDALPHRLARDGAEVSGVEAGQVYAALTGRFWFLRLWHGRTLLAMGRKTIGE